MSPMLSVEALTASYGAVQVLRGIELHVDEGEVVVVLGANGAGKTTTLRAICQMAIVRTAGIVRLGGQVISDLTTPEIAQRGVAHVPQGRGTFAELSVEDNLEAGAFSRPRSQTSDVRADLAHWCEVFPRLGERRKQQAGSLSGGEQQMLAIARAMMSRPKVVLLDEPSLGLAPIITKELFARLAELNRTQGVTMLIVEQNANIALGIAHRGYVMETGRVTQTGSADDLRHDEGVRRAYLGV